jgi:two-component system OmpR family response regulator
MDVMIVESDRQSAEIIADKVREWGHRATVTRTFQQAAQIADQRAYDLMLLNPLLPDGNGLKLIPLLKRAWPQTRIVIVCASHSRALELEALENGVMYYMPKPVDITRVKSIVDYVDDKISGNNTG